MTGQRSAPQQEPRFLGMLAAFCLLFLWTAGLAGCELLPPTPQPSPVTEEPEATPTVAPTETPLSGTIPVVFWEPFALDRPQGMLLGEMVRDFEAENPGIRVEIVPKSGYLGIHSAILAELPDGELPDLAVAFPSMISEYAAAGVVMPLDDYVYDPALGLSSEELADIFPGHLEAGRLPGHGGQLLAFPFALNAMGMWVNDTLLAQSGWDRVPGTWAEFEQACFDLYASTGVRCVAFVESVSAFYAWLYSRGGAPLDDSLRQATFNSPAGVESLALFRRLIDSGLAWRPEEAYGDLAAFAHGQVAFAFSSTGNSLIYVDAYQGALENGAAPFQWHQAMIPQADPESRVTALYGACFFLLQGDPERQEAAWRLVRWFTGARQAGRWAGSMETAPLRPSALGFMTETLEAYPFVQHQVEEILPYGRPEPAIRAELEVREILYTAMLSVTQGFSEPQAALDSAAEAVNAILAVQP